MSHSLAKRAHEWDTGPEQALFRGRQNPTLRTKRDEWGTLVQKIDEE